jgi:hypothetical protein
MRGKQWVGIAVLAMCQLVSPRTCAWADDAVYWHIDPSVKTCSMVIDPSLTQAQWRTFTRQAGNILGYRSLAPAEPLGRGNFEVGIDYSITPIDQRDLAWINTFTHPDENCPLGDRIETPTLRARVGVSSKMDLGAFWTTAPNANYGAVGGELKYSFLEESARIPAAAVSSSIVVLTGVPDFNLSVYSVGVRTSKRMAGFTPYLGMREGLAIGTETTTKVDLKTESVALTQGFVGGTYSIWKVGLAAEYNIANVNTFAFVVGIHP